MPPRGLERKPGSLGPQCPHLLLCWSHPCNDCLPQFPCPLDSRDLDQVSPLGPSLSDLLPRARSLDPCPEPPHCPSRCCGLGMGIVFRHWSPYPSAVPVHQSHCHTRSVLTVSPKLSLGFKILSSPPRPLHASYAPATLL